jgi:hypothetical protein
MVKGKRTSAQVAAAIEKKEALRRQAEALEQQRIATLAELELQEELNEEEEERAVVRNSTHNESLDDIEDIAMESDDGGDKKAMAEDAISENDPEEDEVIPALKPAPKKTQVRDRVVVMNPTEILSSERKSLLQGRREQLWRLRRRA